MDFPKNILNFFKEPNYMVLGTLNKNGSPQMTIVWFEYADGVFKVSTTKERIKYKNMARDPRVACVIYDRGNPYRYTQIQGSVINIATEGGHDFIDHLSRRYTGNPKYKNDPERKENRVVISIVHARFSGVGFVNK